ncbi:hypothetical protein [Erwinia sp. V71]|uniref:hypothetical protein n=1 Tax=Erwinia sp. V71 TaxID=3369424 RepID=UPI003F5D65FF
MNNIRSMLLIILFTSWTSSVMAERRDGENLSGSVRFYGTVVDGGCSVHLQHDNRLLALCRQNGQHADAQQAATSSPPLPLRQGTTRFSWLDRSKVQALVTVTYY